MIGTAEESIIDEISTVNGEVVTAFEEGPLVMINGEEVSVNFDGSDVVVD